MLPAASAAIVINGLQGTYLHLRGITQRPGGFTRYNMESGPPAFAPLLASLVGGMGLLAAVLRRERLPLPGDGEQLMPFRSPSRSAPSRRSTRAASPASTCSTRCPTGTTSPPGWCWLASRRPNMLSFFTPHEVGVAAAAAGSAAGPGQRARECRCCR